MPPASSIPPFIRRFLDLSRGARTRSRLTLLCIASLPIAIAPASAAVPDGFTRVRSLAGIDEYRYEPNGLTVLLKPDHSAPVVTFMVTYRVGSRNEVTGTTGATHILEHLMFKGSEHFNDPAGNSVKQYLGRAGAQFNATTSIDRTNYFATLGRDSLEGYIAIEADRMRNLWLHESDRQAEMTVVRNEFERGKNNPDSVLDEEVTATAYQALPYHHSTIGWKSDIENVPIEKLRDFYNTFYWPNNATVTVVGDVEPDAVLGMVRKFYGGYTRSPQPIPEIYTQEPEQTGPRRVVVKLPGKLGSVLIAHKVPNARDTDSPAIDVLDSILSTGKNSRLYRALVDTGLATRAYATNPGTRDLGLHNLYASLAPGAQHEQVEKALLAEVDRIAREGVTDEEVATAVRHFQRSLKFRRDGSASIARELNEYIAVGDWTLYATYADSLAKVTNADVQRVAKKYLIEDQSTTGWYIPTAPRREK